MSRTGSRGVVSPQSEMKGDVAPQRARVPVKRTTTDDDVAIPSAGAEVPAPHAAAPAERPKRLRSRAARR